MRKKNIKLPKLKGDFSPFLSLNHSNNEQALWHTVQVVMISGSLQNLQLVGRQVHFQDFKTKSTNTHNGDVSNKPKKNSAKNTIPSQPGLKIHSLDYNK